MLSLNYQLLAMQFQKKITFLHILLLILIIVAFSNLFHAHLNSYLTTTLEKITGSLAFVTEFKHVALAGSSSHIPLVSGGSQGLASTLDKATNYLALADGLVALQLILINLSKSLLIKLIMVVFFVGLFFERYKSFCLKALVLLLLLNPGLAIYTSTVRYVSAEAKLSDGNELHQHLIEIKEKYAQKEAAHKAKIAARNQRQLEKAQAKGKDKIGLIKRIEDKVADVVTDAADTIEEGIAELFAVLKSVGKQLIEMTINLLVTVIMQFLVLPFGFFYGIVALIKRFSKGVEETRFIEKIVLIETVFMVIAAISIFTYSAPDKTSQVSEVKEKTNVTTLAKPVLGDTSGKPLLGIDVSHFQGDVDWDKIKQAGISFAYVKATQSVSFRDAKFERNWADISTVGLYRGAYHFYMAGHDPKKQAELFINYVKGLDINDLPPMLDLEEGGMKPGIDPKKYQENVFIWLDIVEKAFSRKPIIYTDHPYGNKYLTDPKFGEYGLWIADWEKRVEPRIPDAWKGKWVLWQRSEKGKIEGAIGEVDHDLFNGTIKDFQTFIKK